MRLLLECLEDHSGARSFVLDAERASDQRRSDRQAEALDEGVAVFSCPDQGGVFELRRVEARYEVRWRKAQ